MEIPGQNMPAWRLGKMRHAMVSIPFLLAVGVLPALAATLPAYCGGVGAKSYTPPAVTIPAVVLNRGTVTTVTNTSMLINDDTSSVSAPPESRASTWWPEWMPRVQTRCSSCWLHNLPPNGKLLESKVDLEEPRSHCLRCDSVAPGRPRPWYPPHNPRNAERRASSSTSGMTGWSSRAERAFEVFYAVDFVCFLHQARRNEQ